ncbi:hypothetical protein FHS29_001537 [Saccharothrix tamanrassetensis]|uniref:Uncharacterized protein n=1 Tax=Saccharothrix tamanrassetensis TaxID=1051531 RepID=A0A841CFN3_9PSEU|nr:hypothetical protein [Saccharothrix tamanrassetensis]MBB5954967.1 hypothetical protein [Saccharothrix tamanrassetensis]
MSGDFSDDQGLADWLDGFEPGGPGGPGAFPRFGSGATRFGGAAAGAGGPAARFDGVGDEPAYPVSFGWAPPLIPLPRRAPDELF